MTVKPRNYLIIGSGLAVALALAGVAYALSSSSFASRAASWTTANCTQKLLSSRNTNTNNQMATECFNYFKNQEQDGLISGMSSGKAPVLLDGNNTVLGTMVDSQGLSFYNPTLNKIVNLDYSKDPLQVQSLGVDFTSSDCTGTPFSLANSKIVGISIVKGGGKYYTLNTAVAPVTHTVYSHLGDSCTVYNGGAGLAGVTEYTLNQVTLPFPDPIVQPVHIATP